jgi:hypothetical protein
MFVETLCEWVTISTLAGWNLKHVTKLGVCQPFRGDWEQALNLQTILGPESLLQRPIACHELVRDER